MMYRLSSAMGMFMSRKKSFRRCSGSNEFNDDDDDEDPIYDISTTLKHQLYLMDFTENDISEVKRAFCMFDKNRNGHIPRKSFLTLMRSLGQNPTEDEYADMLNEVDADRNGLIEFSEFVSLIARTTTKLDEISTYLFCALGNQDTGVIQRNHLRKILLIEGTGLTPRDIEEMLDCFRHDASGNIDITEFVRVWKSLPKINEGHVAINGCEKSWV